jgi:hypothetical protein
MTPPEQQALISIAGRARELANTFVEELTSLVDASELIMAPNETIELLARHLVDRDVVAAMALGQAIQNSISNRGSSGLGAV